MKIAYKRFLADKKQKSSKEQDQKFFTSFASLWAANMSSEQREFKRENDSHALPNLQVNATLSHIDEWYEAFDIDEKSPLYIPKSNRFNLW